MPDEMAELRQKVIDLNAQVKTETGEWRREHDRAESAEKEVQRRDDFIDTIGPEMAWTDWWNDPELVAAGNHHRLVMLFNELSTQLKRVNTERAAKETAESRLRAVREVRDQFVNEPSVLVSGDAVLAELCRALDGDGGDDG